MQGSDTSALRRFAWRFAWMTLVIFTLMMLGLLAGSAFFSQILSLWGDYAYVVQTSLITAVTFGGLFAALATLWPSKRRKSNPFSAR